MMFAINSCFVLVFWTATTTTTSAFLSPQPLVARTKTIQLAAGHNQGPPIAKDPQ